MVQSRIQGLRLQPPEWVRDMHQDGCEQLRQLRRQVSYLPLQHPDLLQLQVRLHVQPGMEGLRLQFTEWVRDRCGQGRE